MGVEFGKQKYDHGAQMESRNSKGDSGGDSKGLRDESIPRGDGAAVQEQQKAQTPEAMTFESNDAGDSKQGSTGGAEQRSASDLYRKDS